MGFVVGFVVGHFNYEEAHLAMFKYYRWELHRASKTINANSGTEKVGNEMREAWVMRNHTATSIHSFSSRNSDSEWLIPAQSVNKAFDDCTSYMYSEPRRFLRVIGNLWNLLPKCRLRTWQTKLSGLSHFLQTKEILPSRANAKTCISNNNFIIFPLGITWQFDVVTNTLDWIKPFLCCLARRARNILDCL